MVPSRTTESAEALGAFHRILLPDSSIPAPNYKLKFMSMITTAVRTVRNRDISPSVARVLATGSRSYLVIIALSLLLTLPLWIIQYPPLVDYPNHLARAFVLVHMSDPQYKFDHFYQADWGFYPYLFSDLITIGLQRFLGIAAAGRVVLSLCIFTLPIATLFLIRQANPGHEYLALWSLVIAYSPPFLMGFVSSQLSLPLWAFFVGFWIVYLKKPTWATWAIALALATLLYFTHLLGFGGAGLFVAAAWISGARRFREAVASLTIFMPGSLLYLYSRFRVTALPPNHFSFDLHSKLSDLVTPFRGYSRVIDAITIAVACLCVVATCSTDRKVGLNRRWLPASFLLFLAFWVVPPEYGTSGYVDMRIPAMALILALCVIQIGDNRRWLVLGACSLFVLRTLDVTVQFCRESAHLTELSRSFVTIPAGATVLPMTNRYSGDKYWSRADVHFWAYGVIERGWLTPSLFHIRGFQPLKIRESLYCCNASCSPLVDRDPDWALISQSYRYIWADNTPDNIRKLARIGSQVYSHDSLAVFRIEKGEDLPLL